MRIKRSRTALALGILLAAIACRPAPTIAPEGFVEVPGGRVFYTTMGSGDRTPLLLLHGGPGGRSCGFSVLRELSTDRRVIRYDQLGSGQSDRPPLISTPRWLQDTRRLRLTLPEPVQSALNKCEAVETADDASCQAANDVFEEHFVRGARTLPAVPECDGITGGDQVYRHMWGAGEFTATGLLRDYDRSDRLGELKLPVLFLAGRHDEAAPETIADFQGRVPGAKMAVLENSAHSTYRTETAEYVRIVRQFLDDAERR